MAVEAWEDLAVAILAESEERVWAAVAIPVVVLATDLVRTWAEDSIPLLVAASGASGGHFWTKTQTKTLQR